MSTQLYEYINTVIYLIINIGLNVFNDSGNKQIE